MSTCWVREPINDAELRAPGPSGWRSGARPGTCSSAISRSTSHHHFGITVDDLEPVYRAAERRDAFDDIAFKNRLVELPGDVVQLYLRHPAGNLVEVDAKPGRDGCPEDMRARLQQLWDFNPHTEEQLKRAPIRARLVHRTNVELARKPASTRQVAALMRSWVAYRWLEVARAALVYCCH